MDRNNDPPEIRPGNPDPKSRRTHRPDLPKSEPNHNSRAARRSREERYQTEKAKKEAIVQLIRDGYSFFEISIELDLSVGFIRKVAAEHDLMTFRPVVPGTKDAKDILDLYEAGLNPEEIAVALNIFPRQVWSFLRKYGPNPNEKE